MLPARTAKYGSDVVFNIFEAVSRIEVVDQTGKPRAWRFSLPLASDESGDRDLGSQSSLREDDGNMAIQIMFAAFEELVLLHIQDDIQVARRAAFATGVSLARNPQLGTVVDAGRYFDFERFFPDDTAIAMTDRTTILDDLPRAVTLPARPGNTEETLLKANLTVSMTRRARGWPRSFLRAAAIAFRAGLVARDFDLGGCSECRFVESEIEVIS